MRKKPVDILVFDKKHKRSKKEIQQRKDAEIKLGDKKFLLPPNVKHDKIAYKKWKELISLYSEMEFVSSADSDILSQYCLAYSEYEFLITSHSEIIKDAKKKKKTALELVETLNKSNLDNMINKKREALQKIGTKIFLDPTSRIKAVPVKTPEKPASPLDQFVL